jgi:hypothetical protein
MKKAALMKKPASPKNQKSASEKMRFFWLNLNECL